MAKARTTTTIEFPVAEFSERVLSSFPELIGKKNVTISYNVRDVSNDYLDRGPEIYEVTSVDVTFDGSPEG